MSAAQASPPGQAIKEGASHPKLGSFLGRAECTHASKAFFSSLRDVGIKDIQFGDVAAFAPKWLHGLTLIDALAYSGTSAVLKANILELRMRFAR